MKTIQSTIRPPKHSYAFPQGKEHIAFFDIETTGLSPRASSLYLIGAMSYDAAQHQWNLQQWFADDYRSEKEMIQRFLAFLDHYGYLYHFNGKTFDIPYLLHKCRKHGVTLNAHCREILEDTDGTRSIDLLQRIRKLRRPLLLDKCSQTALENWLGCRREDSFNGGELIPVYSEYMQQKILNPEMATNLEKILLLHNHDDIEMMLEVCSILSYEDYLLRPEENPTLEPKSLAALSCRREKDRLILKIPNLRPIPKKVCILADYPVSGRDGFSLPSAELTLSAESCALSLPLFSGSLKYFYPDPQNYYYLPEEDIAVHKSVGEFVEKAYRRNATAATCYTRISGDFLPRLSPCPRQKKTAESSAALPLLFLEYRDRLSFCQLPKDYTQNPEFWAGILPWELRAFFSTQRKP